MKKNFSDISGYVNVVNLRNNRRIIVFLICFMIATVMWFLNALSKDYEATITYPVKYSNPPKNRFLADTPPAKMDIDINGRGFTLLRYKLLSFSPVNLDLDAITRNIQPKQGKFAIPTVTLIGNITEQLSSDIKINGISPEIIEVVLDSLISKTVSVILDVNVDFEPQYNLKNPISTNPQNVKITGPTSVLDKISVLKTKVVISNKLNSSIQQKIDLIHPGKTTISPENVFLKIDVEKYTEKELQVPITAINKPGKARIKLFPSEIKILFTVGLSNFENIKPSDFGASVDFNSIKPGTNNLAITIYKQPKLIQNLRYNPQEVEFLIERN